MMRHLPLFFSAIFVALTLAGPAGAIEEGNLAPDFTLTDLLTSEPFSLEEYRGQVVVLNFWAYW